MPATRTAKASGSNEEASHASRNRYLPINLSTDFSPKSKPFPSCTGTSPGMGLGGAPGTIKLSPEPSQQVAIDNLIGKILTHLPSDMDCRERGARVIAKLRDLVGDLPASAAHHHSTRFGLLRHSLEVALKMLEQSSAAPVTERPPTGPSIVLATVGTIHAGSTSISWPVFAMTWASSSRWMCGKEVGAGLRCTRPTPIFSDKPRQTPS